MKTTINFPVRVWDGSSGTRENLQVTKQPDGTDYLQCVAEIRAMQKYLLDLTNNITIMPDLEGVLKESANKIKELHTRLNALSLPVEFQQRIEAAEEGLRVVDSFIQDDSIQNELSRLQNQSTANQLEILEIKKTIETHIKGFQNKLRNEIENHNREVDAKIFELKETVTRLNTLLSIKALAERLGK